MKFTTSTVLAGLAATAAADSWESWSSVDPAGTTLPVLTVTVCPSEVTDTVTKTKTVAAVTSEVYATTVTVEAPKTKTVTVYPGGETALGAWEEWKPSTSSSSSSPSSVTSTPAGCVPHVVTTTKIESIKVANSTTTISKSTLFIGDGKSAKTTVTVTATGSSSAWAYGTDSASTTASWDPWSGSGDSASSSASASKSGHKSGSSSYSNSVAAAASSDKVVATGADAFKWTVAPGPSVTSVSEAPVYTQKPDGNWGAGNGGNDGWENWNGGSSASSSAASSSSSSASNSGSGSGSNNGNGSGSGSGNGSGSGSGLGGNNGTSSGNGNGSGTGAGNGSGSGSNNGNGSGSGNGIGGNNGTSSGNGSGNGIGSGNGNGNGIGGGFGNGTFNGTVPIPGSSASNVTRPFPALKEVGCNSPSDRSVWCNGKNVKSDYYEDYNSHGHCRYELFITNTTINFDGDLRPALAVNGQVPGPVIECNWGDLVSVTVHNLLQDNGTAIHWHGIRQFGSNDMDGVPGITECPLAPGASRTYTWRASSYGTSWYHSHWATQYGDGIYGPIVIHGPATANYDVDAGVVAIADTFPTTAAQWNALIAHVGPLGTTNYLLNGHNTKADLSAGQHSLWKVQKGKKYLFRLLNAASQNMFSVSVDSHTMTVVAADFIPIVPYQTQWLNIGIGQRYDVVIEMNQAVDSYFLRAVTQTQCPSTCNNTGLAQANGVIAYEGVQETPYLLPTSTVNGNVTIADFNICDDEPLASLVPAVTKTGGDSDLFKAQVSTVPAGAVNRIATNDDGLVFRWFINNGFINMDYTEPTLKILADKQNVSLVSNAVILPDANVWVYFVIQNQFFASHPMHLHGHDFSLLGQGPGVFDETMVGTLNFANPMRRDTAMLKGALNPFAGVPGYTVIGFETDNPGAWLMHCHIVWHVDGGLALEFLERPDEITADQYVSTGFNDKCDAYTTYQNSSPYYQRPSWESGLKKRSTFFDEQVERLNMGMFDSVVRRADSPEKRYINSHALKRGIGHSRHFRR